jgi:small subunit ribosomal protein S16
MLKIRLQRRGKKNHATFRVVVAEQHAPVKGRFIADVGAYNPHTNVFDVKADKVQDWITKGAQPSDTVHNLLITHKIIKGEKKTIWRAPQKAEETTPATEAPTETPAA